MPRNSSSSHQNPEPETRNPTPWWETAVIGGSFLLLWVWWLARQAALRANETQAWWWHGVLLLTFIALLYIMARRTKRVVRAIRGEDETSQKHDEQSRENL